MDDNDDGVFNFDSAKNFPDFVRDALNDPERADEMIELLKAEPYDLTTHMHAVLYALGYEHLVQYIGKVEVRVGNSTVGFGMEVRKDYDPAKAPEEEKLVIAKAITAILRSGGLPAVQNGKRVFVHADDCDGNCGIEHEAIDPFAAQVSAFREELDTVLGPDRPPDEGWAQWMGRG